MPLHAPILTRTTHYNTLHSLNCWNGNFPRVPQCGLTCFCQYILLFLLFIVHYQLSMHSHAISYCLYSSHLTEMSYLLFNILYIYIIVSQAHLRCCCHTKCNLRCATYFLYQNILILNIPVAYLFTVSLHHLDFIFLLLVCQVCHISLSQIK